GGRSRRVQQGETINGMLVAEVQTNRVKLTQAGDSEELTLKVAGGPRVTVQPVVAVAPVPGAPVASAQPQQPPSPAAQQQPAATQDVSEVLANRRRAARAAEAAASGAAAAQTQQPPPPPAAPARPVQQPAPDVPQAADPAWNELYQRYIQPRR